MKAILLNRLVTRKTESIRFRRFSKSAWTRMEPDLFSPEARRDPFPLYKQFRETAPVAPLPGTGRWLVFDYENVKRCLTDHETFSSRLGPAEWIVFLDPPRHTQLRALVAQAFTSRSVGNLEPRIRELSRDLLNRVIERGEMDLVADYSSQLPMLVIAEMLGAPLADRDRFARWNGIILKMSYTVPGGGKGEQAHADFIVATREMNDYLSALLEDRRRQPRDDLFTRLLSAEIDGQRLTQLEILNFFQLLLLAGSETTTNLINNSILSFLENPDQLARLKSDPNLLPSAIEEVLRYRSPLQWMIRLTRRDAQIQGQTIPAGKVVLAMMGSANRDPRAFDQPDRFDIGRNPNPHVAFGHGIHFCLGASLSRLEARVALPHLVDRLENISLASDQPWPPRDGLHVHGPDQLLIRFKPGKPG